MIRFLLITIVCTTLAMGTSSMNGISVKGYFDLDDNIDTIRCSEDGKETICKIVDSNIGFKITENNNCSEISIKSCDDKGCLQMMCSIWGYEDTLFYMYDQQRNDFYLTKKIHEKLPMDGPDDKGYSKVYHYESLLWNIDKTSFKIGKIKALRTLDSFLADLYKSKAYSKIKIVAQDIYNVNIRVSKSNLSSYNNIAYYFQKAGANQEAIFLLEKILKKYPNRTVAYYNLGDAYWAIDKKEKAKQAYKTYIKQMTAKGKEKKIPKTVLQRVH